MKILLMVIMSIVSFSSSVYGDTPSTKYINNMIVLNQNEDIDVAKIEMRGNGEFCRLSFESTGIIYDDTSCLTIVNSKGVKVYCTPTKKLCKTYDEIYAFMFEPKYSQDTNHAYSSNSENNAIPKKSNEVQNKITWRSLGIGIDNPGQITDWTYFGIKTPQEASLWIDAFKSLGGISYSGAARIWKQEGFSAEDAKNWIHIGAKTPEKVSTWLRSGVKDFREVQLWQQIGVMDYNKVSQWKSYGVNTPTEANEWMSISITAPMDGRVWRGVGIKTPSDVIRWKEIGVHNASDASEWIIAGATTVEKVKEWQSMGIKDGTALSQYIEHGISKAQEKKLSNNSYPPKGLENNIPNENTPLAKVNSGIYNMNTEVYTDEDVVPYLEQSNSDIWNVFLLGYFIVMIITMFKGYGENRTIIIFRDYNDLGLTFLIPASVVLIFILFTSFGGDPEFGMGLAFIVALVLFGILVKNTYMDNNKSLLYTLMSLMTKVPLGIIWILNFITMLNPGGKTAVQRRKNRGTALVILAFLTPIMGMLVANKEGSLFNPKDWIKGKRIGEIRNYI